MTYILYCTNIECGLNKNSRCSLRQIVIDRNGKCMISTSRPGKTQLPSAYVTRKYIAKKLGIQVQLLSYHILSLGIKHNKKIKGVYCYEKDRIPHIIKTIKFRLKKQKNKYAKEEDRLHGK